MKALQIANKRRRVMTVLAGVVLTGATIGAKQKAWDAARLSTAFQAAPPSAQQVANPFEGQSDAVKAGAKLYRQHCAQCHGENQQGLNTAPGLRSPAVQQAPPGVLFWFLRNGNVRRGMPSWAGLPDQQRWQLVSYLKKL
jgi:mono/diheme cytochrome c family protein